MMNFRANRFSVCMCMQCTKWNFQTRMDFISILDEMISLELVNGLPIRPSYPLGGTKMVSSICMVDVCFWIDTVMAFVRLMKIRPRAQCSSFAIWIPNMSNQLQLAMNLNCCDSLMCPLLRIISMQFEFRDDVAFDWNFHCWMPNKFVQESNIRNFKIDSFLVSFKRFMNFEFTMWNFAHIPISSGEIGQKSIHLRLISKCHFKMFVCQSWWLLEWKLEFLCHFGQ